MSEHDQREAQLADIRRALAHPGRQVPMPCDDTWVLQTALQVEPSLTEVYADRFGRLWVWWPDEKVLKMIFDPREARG